ncbi:O-antigen ligase family protein [Campylobacter geochelonis]|uniref:O-antigen ligase family protein n=1 Tax=Campylobacter geochelonis TaxID=1780362 RepID=UPI000770B644|nr:O-antigen polymerase [Campylobacter geochelonis]CZE49287.1 Lipid A core-O-antigen ligase and related enzymes [Campylobacter geochelonis]CZE51407.1 Lipid A core-O-antigen ligase and related enzymes [Campylobacter geochelonis]
MKVHLTKIKYSYLSFLLLFPGFFLYNILIAKNYISPVLGGYFGIVSGFVLLSYIILYILKSKSIYISGLEILFLVYQLFLIFMYTSYFLLGKPNILTQEIYFYNMKFCLYNISLYFVAKNLLVTKRFSNLCFILFVIMFIIIIMNFSLEYKILILQKTATVEYGKEYISTYQGMGRSLMATAFIFLSFYLRSKISIFLFLIVCIALYMNGARTEFLFTIIAYSFLVFYLSSFKNKLYFMFFIGLIVLFIFVFYDYLPNNRVTNILNISTDLSSIHRIKLMFFSLDKIIESPFIGDYSAYVFFNGELGDYAHTAIISVWLNLGLFGLIFLTLIMFYIIALVFIGLNRNQAYDLNFMLFALTSIYFILAFTFTKDYGYMFLGFVVGLYSNYKNNNLILSKKNDILV